LATTKLRRIAHYAMDNDLTLKQAALTLGFVTEAEFDRVVDPKKKWLNPTWQPPPLRLWALGQIVRCPNDVGGAFQSCSGLCPCPVFNGQATDQTLDAAQRLGETLELRGKLMPRWESLQLQAEDGHARLISAVEADPAGVNMDRVASTMRAIEDLGGGSTCASRGNRGDRQNIKGAAVADVVVYACGGGGRRSVSGDLWCPTSSRDSAHICERGGRCHSAP